MKKKCAMLWTGGKDSALALLLAQEEGNDVELLVTFAPENPDFAAHPIAIQQKQSALLGIPHRVVTITEPYREAYVAALRDLARDIDRVVTGDIDEVDGHPNWIAECCAESKTELFRPLWKIDRAKLIRSYADHTIVSMISLVNTTMMKPHWLGKVLDEKGLQHLAQAASLEGFDACGENGEFHTIVMMMPGFSSQLQLKMLETIDHQPYLFFVYDHD